MRQLTRLVVDEARIHKIRLTGGEPNLIPDLAGWVRFARALVPEVGLTSNGIGLGPRLAALREAGLQKLNISLDAVNDDDNQRISRRDHLNDTLPETIRQTQELDFQPLRVNAVAMQQSDVAGLVQWAIITGVHFRFIELMNIGEAIPWHQEQYISSEDIRRTLFNAGFALFPAPDLDAPTSRVWTIPGVDPRTCTIGFITTTSQPFCHTCDRLRLTSQGRLHTCLFDESGHDLRTALATSESAARSIIRHAIAGKQPPEQFYRAANMAAIGG